MELRIEPYKLPEAPVFNYADLKAALQEKMTLYEATIYSDDQIKQAKADKASLNRLKKALNDERIKREREYMQPFSTFKSQINEIIEIIDKPVKAIDKQVTEFEDRRKAEKQQQILEFWEKSGAPEWMHTIDTRWLNATASMKSIQAEICENIEKANKDLAVIRALPAYAFEAEEYYKNTQNLAEAVSEAHRLSEMAERKAAHEAAQAKRNAEAVAAEKSTATEPEISAAPPAEPKKYVVSFRATLTIEQARELRDFFQSRGIEYEKI